MMAAGTAGRGGTWLLPLLVAGCEGPQNVLDPAGPAARGLAGLGVFVLLLFLAATAVVWALIAWLALRRRGSLDEHAPVDAGGGQRWILLGGFAIPAAVLAVVFISSILTIGSYPLAAPDAEPDIRLVAQQWWFNAEYPRPEGLGHVNSPTEIHIPVGEPVDIELVSRDVIHSFWVPRLHGKVDMVPGQVNRIRIRAEEPGVYRGQCAEFCGMQHAHMRLSVVAQPPAEFRAWLRTQAAEARPPGQPASRRGHDIFMRSACLLCHTVRGTAAHGNVGPELTHLASRERIAGGMLSNNTANLSAWVTHAQSLKPGARMPDITAFSGTELRDLVAYLQSLE